MYFENFTMYRETRGRFWGSLVSTLFPKTKTTPRVGIEYKNVQKKVFSQEMQKQCHICSGKGCNMYLSTVVYNVMKNIFFKIFIPDENIAIHNECCFRWTVPLISQLIWILFGPFWQCGLTLISFSAWIYK